MDQTAHRFHRPDRTFPGLHGGGLTTVTGLHIASLRWQWSSWPIGQLGTCQVSPASGWIFGYFLLDFWWMFGNLTSKRNCKLDWNAAYAEGIITTIEATPFCCGWFIRSFQDGHGGSGKASGRWHRTHRPFEDLSAIQCPPIRFLIMSCRIAALRCWLVTSISCRSPSKYICTSTASRVQPKMQNPRRLVLEFLLLIWRILLGLLKNASWRHLTRS